MRLGKQGEFSNIGSPSSVEQYEYIADLLNELKVMAENLEADVLAHIIEVAMLEAHLQREVAIDPRSHDI